MTSTTDEITNLRRGLADLLNRCQQNAIQADVGSLPSAQWDEMAEQIRRFIKTQRASQIVPPDTLRLDWILDNCEVNWVVDGPRKQDRRTRKDIDDMRGL